METEWVRRFENFLFVEKSASPNTVSAYRADLRQFEQNCPHRRSWAEVTTQDVNDTLAKLEQQGLKTSSIARKLAAIKSFFSFLNAEGLVVNPLDEVRSIAVAQEDIHPLTPEELARLRQQAKSVGGPEAHRNQLIIELLLATGMRITELISTKVGDVNLDTEPTVIRCERKEQERTFTLPTEAGALLKVYLFQVRPQLLRRGRREEALLLNRRGDPITRQGCWLILSELGRKARLDSARVTPANLRHTFAVNYLAAQNSLQDLQSMLGHASPHTTSVYRTLVPA